MNQSLSVGDRVSFDGGTGTVTHIFSVVTIIQPDLPFDVRGVELKNVQRLGVSG
jgi:hypothetical protein